MIRKRGVVRVVIQSNMKVIDIVANWKETKTVFQRYGININTTKTISEAVPMDVAEILLRDLNHSVGSSEATCIEGG
jgi:hypothetical protein